MVFDILNEIRQNFYKVNYNIYIVILEGEKVTSTCI